MPVGELLFLQLFLSLGRTLCRKRLLTPHNYVFYLFTQVSSSWSSSNSNTSAVCFLYAAVSALGGCTLLSVGRYRLVCLPLSPVSLWNLSRSLADKGKYQNRQNKLAECWVFSRAKMKFHLSVHTLLWFLRRTGFTDLT